MDLTKMSTDPLRMSLGSIGQCFVFSFNYGHLICIGVMLYSVVMHNSIYFPLFNTKTTTHPHASTRFMLSLR